MTRLFRPVRAGNAFEDTVARLLQTIRLGVVAPGEGLPSERDLAVRFSVSRDTVRDAIKAERAVGPRWASTSRAWPRCSGASSASSGRLRRLGRARLRRGGLRCRGGRWPRA